MIFRSSFTCLASGIFLHLGTGLIDAPMGLAMGVVEAWCAARAQGETREYGRLRASLFPPSCFVTRACRADTLRPRLSENVDE